MAYSRKRLIPCVSARAEAGASLSCTPICSQQALPPVILGPSSAWTTSHSPFSPASKCSRGVECKGHSALTPADLIARVPSQQRAPISARPHSALANVVCVYTIIFSMLSKIISDVSAQIQWPFLNPHPS